MPGVSGGVLAVIFGVYRPFMEILSNPKSAVPRYWRMLIPLGVGWAAGFFLIARGISAALTLSESVSVCLFVGLIAGSVPALYREAGKEGRPRSSWVCLTLCAVMMFAVLFYVRRILKFQAAPNFLWYGFCGILIGIGAALPGFSASPVMMSLGLYQPLLEDLSRMDVSALSSCLTGAALSTLSLARLMNRLFRTRHSAVSHGILGVVTASAVSMIPLRYDGGGELCASAISAAAGFLLALRMDRIDRRLKVK